MPNDERELTKPNKKRIKKVRNKGIKIRVLLFCQHPLPRNKYDASQSMCRLNRCRRWCLCSEAEASAALALLLHWSAGARSRADCELPNVDACAAFDSPLTKTETDIEHRTNERTNEGKDNYAPLRGV